jgi:hypothetical protein
MVRSAEAMVMLANKRSIRELKEEFESAECPVRIVLFSVSELRFAPQRARTSTTFTMRPRYNLIILLLSAVTLTVGCGGPKFNQGQAVSAAGTSVAPATVKLFADGQPPDSRFEIVSALSTADAGGNYRGAMQKAAAKLGADAVIGVHDFRAPRTLGIHLQSGIAVRLLPETDTARAGVARPGVALVALLEAVPDKTNTFAEVRDTMLLLGGLQLHTMGYCPIYVNTPLPSGAEVPSTATFDLLKASEASHCEKMVVLRLTRRDQTFAGVGGRGDVEMKAELIGRDNSVLWTNTTRMKSIGIGPLGGITAASTAFVGQAAAKTVRTMPKNN